MFSIGDSASVAVTAIPGNVAGILAVENLRTTRQNDQFGDPLRRTVLCNVRNVGSGSLARYVVNYSVRTPVDAPEGITAMVAPEPGLFAGEVDLAELETDDDGSVEAFES